MCELHRKWRRAKNINKIKGDYFGFINLENRRYGSWYDCFKMMMNDLMEDAETEKVVLPVTKKQLMDLICHYRSVFKEIKKPVLVHKDLWDGNIFVDPDSFEIKGIIDCERALYGDPLLEAVCGFLDENKSFMDCFYGKEPLSDNEKLRIKLYHFYLFLLMVVECHYRQYEDKGIEEWVRNRLQETLSELSGRCG